MPSADRIEKTSSPIREGSEHADLARSTLSDADGLAYVLDLDRETLERTAHEQPLLESFRTLNQAQTVARRLRELAEEFEIAGAAYRDEVSRAISRHDGQAEELRHLETPRLIPASQTDRPGRSEGVGRGR